MPAAGRVKTSYSFDAPPLVLFLVAIEPPHSRRHGPTYVVPVNAMAYDG